MKKSVIILTASALAMAGAAFAQPAAPAQAPAGRGNVANMTGTPVAPPVSAAKVLMLRTMVSDLEQGYKFYHEVFGLTSAMGAMGGMGGMGAPGGAGRGAAPAGAPPAAGAAPAGAPPRAPGAPGAPGGPGAGGGRGGGGIMILNFPGGSPGMIMIKGSGGPDMMRGSYVIQVPDLAAALAKAEANGGKVQTTRFMGGGGSESRHVIDPFGNDLEIMQGGKAP